jgi:hypothetical protein
MDLMRLLGLVGAFVPAWASDEDSIDELLQLSHYDAMIEDSRATCIAAAAEMSPERLVREDPTYLGGITPESECWPSIERVFQVYYEGACDYADRHQVVEVLRDGLGRRMTSQELREVVAFLRSPTGSKYVAASFEVSRTINELFVSRYAETVNEARVQASLELGRVIVECANSCENREDGE